MNATDTQPILILPFVLTALTAAFLLFWVEPLFARMVLPLLGGSPAVWNTCLMYFQAALLGGYLYAHLSTRYLGVRAQSVLHLILLAVAMIALPLAIPAGWAPPASDQPIGWLLLLLTVAVGGPFLVLSATAPLLQRWLSSLDQPPAKDPYQLYAASNAGSLLGLLAFPIALEPNLKLGQQSMLWGAGYMLAAGLALWCVITVWKHRSSLSAPATADSRELPAVALPSFKDRFRWVSFSFVPSSLLLGTTTYLTTDVAAVPFLWVMPLAIYLLTFVIVFARPGRVAPRLPVELHALLVTGLLLVTFWDVRADQRWAYPLHLGVFAVTALVLHGELAASRPSPRHLTEFYLWLAVGGALGGLFNAVAAPVLFNTVAEYIPMVVIACFLRPSRRNAGEGALERLQQVCIAAIPALLLTLVVVRGAGFHRVLGVTVAFYAAVVAGTLALAVRDNAVLFGGSLGAVGLARLLFFQQPESTLLAERSFFGSYRVARRDSVTYLYHGTTVHGAQFADSARQTRPVAYYHPSGPAGQLFTSLGARLDGKHIGVVGLGAGSLLCYGSRGQEWTFFEIDPLVEQIARNPAYFTFLRDCPTQARVVIGDARLTLAREPRHRFALLVLDAFSSDAIPVHLLTREALALYGLVLEPDGFLLIHISNQHLQLEPVVAALAADAGWVVRVSRHSVNPRRAEEELDYGSDWVLMRRQEMGTDFLGSQNSWRAPVAATAGKLWTDDYSNILGVLKWER